MLYFAQNRSSSESHSLNAAMIFCVNQLKKNENVDKIRKNEPLPG